MTTLTLQRLAEIEAAAAEAIQWQTLTANGHHFGNVCDPATVAALVRIAKAAIAVVDQDDRGAYVRRNDAASNAMNALRDAGLLE